ncbi:MAG: hypothetical protein O3A25_13730 [Acidobacteria bacterium]|nr:hypothetical protein [Acidobacteriota bacterium]
MSPRHCPLCGTRRARRACPALGHHICAVCCGTKRLTEIQCPSDCGYLASAKTHPPAARQRQQERDAQFVLPLIAGLTQRQYQLFFLVQGTLFQLAQTGEPPVNDEVIRDTAQALAATYETASKGIIYEHRPTSLHAERLSRELKPLLEGWEGQRPVASEHDLVEVLRRIERAAGKAGSALDGGDRAYLDLVGRLLEPAPGSGRAEAEAPGGEKAGPGPSVIIP